MTICEKVEQLTKDFLSLHEEIREIKNTLNELIEFIGGNQFRSANKPNAPCCTPVERNSFCTESR